jgi:hypothetical protein
MTENRHEIAMAFVMVIGLVFILKSYMWVYDSAIKL